MELENQISNTASLAVKEAILNSLKGYNSPLSKLCEKVTSDKITEIEKMANDAFDEIVTSNFKENFKDALSQRLCKLLVSKFEGQFEKQINALRSHPEMKAKMVLAITKAIETL